MDMKQSTLFRGVVLCVAMLSFASALFAQRYVNVSPGNGTLNAAISADSLNRIANPNTWYVLQRGSKSVYVLTSIIQNWGPTPLQIMSSGTGPLPWIQGGVQTGGVTVDNLFIAYKNLTVRGAYLTGVTTAYSVDQRIMLLEADGVTIRLDSCEVNLAWQSTVRVDNGKSNVFLTNCRISNMNYRFPGNGRVIDNRGVAMDTLFVQNCSILRSPYDVYRVTSGTGTVKYSFWDHNTFNEIARPPVINFNQVDQLVFKNNLLVNCSFVGKTATTAPPITILAATMGVTSAIIKNNCFYLDTALIKPRLPDSVSFCALFDSTLQSFVDKGGTAATNITAALKFKMAPNDIKVDPYLVHLDSIVTWFWAIGGPSQPSQTIFQIDSLQYVNYQYNTDAKAYTGAEGGYPIGDLNWFPDRKTAWGTSANVPLSGKKILFCTKAINDTTFRNKFSSWGATVDTIHYPEFNSTSAATFGTYDLIFLSENLGSADVTILKTLDAPILTTKAHFGQPASGAWFNGTAGNIRSIPAGSVEMIDGTGHALANGLARGAIVQLVDSSLNTTQWLSVTPQDPKVDYIPIARIPGDSTKLIIVGHEKGSKVYSTSTTTGTPDRALKARIAVIGIHNNAYKFVKDSAWTLLLNAAQWVIAGGRVATTVEHAERVPTSFTLSQNYPNPFNPSTEIEFGIPKAGRYSVMVYNVLGQIVRDVVSGEFAAGYHKVTFNASQLASGMYFYQLRGDDVHLVRKMLLVK
jgi:hypothetical protein